ncbi:cytochrome c [Roseomonas sp. AR75]|jgi:mono/diheme cytochrome c family protein|uniref:c-type cytochrome n=1 Tax=Roseomonas sp. AR75 TaxID=2562311 RepID=UPI0010C02492|nr:cytochrome c [Roseomonas sp. AR75]
MRRCTLALALAALALPAFADSSGPAPIFAPHRIAAQDGEGIYRTVCQGCHMPDGRGAQGAARYPSLVANQNLAAGGYPVTIIVQGLRAMPPVGAMMDDAQVAAVVNYIRTHFGNSYTDAVSAEDVKAVR